MENEEKFDKESWNKFEKTMTNFIELSFLKSDNNGMLDSDLLGNYEKIQELWDRHMGLNDDISDTIKLDWKVFLDYFNGEYSLPKEIVKKDFDEFRKERNV